MLYARAILIVFIPMIFQPAWSASFDCEKTLTNIEKLICNDPDLSAMDESVAGRYRKIKELNLGFEQARKTHKAWLMERNRCVNDDCLRKLYDSRIGELERYIDITYRQSIKYKDGSSPCEITAKAVNDETLISLAIRQERSNLDRVMDDWPKYFPDKALSGLMEAYLYEDIDSDGVREHVAIITEGTANINTLFVHKDISEAKTYTFSAYHFGGPHDMFLIKLGHTYYVLAGGYSDPDALWGFGEGGAIGYKCKFITEHMPALTITKGEDKSVCKGLFSGGWRYVDYEYSHSLKLSHDPDGRFWSKYPGNKVALVDIDNYGNNEYVTELGFSHGGGRGCDAVYIAVTNDERTDIPRGGVNGIIEDNLWGYPCGADTRIFVFDGMTYIEQEDSPNEKVVSQIIGKQFKNICVYDHNKNTMGIPVRDGSTYGRSDTD